MSQALRRFLILISRIETWAAASCFALMAVLTLLDVISREALRSGVVWAQKSSVYLMIWGGFLGATLTTARGTHLRPEIADRLCPARLHGLLAVLGNLMTSVFCGGMAFFAIRYVLETRSMGDVSVVTGVPVWVVQLVIPYVFASMAVRFLAYSFWPALRPPKPEVPR